MVQQRARFRRQTDLGKRQAARAAAQRRRVDAAVVLQKHVRRRAATRKVSNACPRWLYLCDLFDPNMP